MRSSDHRNRSISNIYVPALTSSSAIALTRRAVGGLATAEIANAFLVPEATMAQRISRAKQRIKNSGVPFEMPTARAQRD
jgi:predicted RNA polymerase sigma factor